MKQKWLVPIVAPLEHILVRIEAPAFAPFYRVSVGFSILPALRLVGGEDPSGLALFAFFVASLFGLRAIPAVMRKVLPFSDQALATWKVRRQTAKRYDSYQWEKLLWIGLGLAAYAGAAGEFTTSTAILVGCCLAGGLAGRLVWLSASRALASGARA